MSPRRTIALLLGVTFALLIATSIAASFSESSSIARFPFRMICHGIPERCLVVFGSTMPVCSRCIGIYAGAIVGIGAALLLRRRLPGIVAALAVLPLAIDGVTQALGIRESTNAIRFATGFVAGAALLCWVIQSLQEKGENEANESPAGEARAGVKS